jgi:PncC family amidohydrolase
VRLTVLARPGDVRVLLLDRGAGAASLEDLTERIAEEIGDACYSTTGETLAQALVRESTARAVTLATAESCTGGLVSAAITDVAGASAVFAGGVVSYSDDSKRTLLGVSAETLKTHGAVSAEVVAQMAAGACEALGADIAVAISGIAGPEGGSADKPAGTVWFAVGVRAADGMPIQVLKHFNGDRELVRLRATTFALDLLRRSVCGLPIA